MKKLIAFTLLLVLGSISNGQDPEGAYWYEEEEEFGVQADQYKLVNDTLEQIDQKWDEIERKVKERGKKDKPE